MEVVMRLSEAIREGHKKLPREQWRANDICGCAIGMALMGADGWTIEKLEAGDKLSIGTPNEPYTRFKELWPWLDESVKSHCPVCGESLTAGSHMFHMFDNHVMGRYSSGSCSIADLIAHIESIENIEPRKATALVCPK